MCGALQWSVELHARLSVRSGKDLQPQLSVKRYQLLGELGTGGMGKVFLGRDDDGSPVAIKKLHAHLVDDPDAVGRFFDEARLAARLEHPNVVRLIDVSMTAGDLVLVMEYIEGASLAAFLRSMRTRAQRPLPWTEALRVVADALRGLHAAHELRDRRGRSLGVIHRDVSPQNLLVGIDGATRVTDFGIALAAGRLKSTHSGSGVAGKVLYLSPEQIQRDPVDRRADVFAAGIVLWECLTGLSLFGSDTEAQTIARVVRGDIAPPSSFANDVPLEVDEICLRALERDPNRRFATAAAFADAIDAAGPAPPAQIGQAMLAHLGEEVRGRQALLAAPRRDDAPMLVAEPPPAVATPARRLVGPGLVAGVLVGVLAGGLTVRVLARPSEPERSPSRTEAPAASTMEASSAALPASTVLLKADAEAPPASSIAAPVISSARPQAPRPAAHKPRPTRRTGDVSGDPFVPKEM